MNKDTRKPTHDELDGQTHINLLYIGATELGRSLSRDALMPFKSKHFNATFKSLEGLWHYARMEIKEESCKNLFGGKAKRLSNTYPTYHMDNFTEVINASMVERVEQNEYLCSMMKKSILPFDMYYVKTNKGVKTIHRPTISSWFVTQHTLIRDNLIKHGNLTLLKGSTAL